MSEEKYMRRTVAYNRTAGIVLALTSITGLFAASASAVNLQDLVIETQRTTQTNGQMTMAWWMPQQFWEESMKANPAVPAAARDQVLAALGDYTVVAMLRAKVGVTGLTEVQPKAELVKNAQFEINGKAIAPLSPEQIAPGAQLVLAQLKPALASMAGQVGQSLELVIYPAKADGKLLVDASQSGTLQIKLYEETFKWRLPLGSLLPARVDAKTGESFPGNYQFNPFTGGKLSAP
jgi:hypothetical protein